MPTDDEARQEIEKVLNDAAQQFDELCIERHEVGLKEYGALTFLGNDVVRMMLEELADTANYCRMQGVKLMILQQRLESGELGQLSNKEGNIELGFQAFQGTKDAGWKR